MRSHFGRNLGEEYPYQRTSRLDPRFFGKPSVEGVEVAPGVRRGYYEMGSIDPSEEAMWVSEILGGRYEGMWPQVPMMGEYPGAFDLLSFMQRNGQRMPQSEFNFKFGFGSSPFN